MNIPKFIGVATAIIPIGGLLIGGITFGVNFKTDVQEIKQDVQNQQQVNADVREWFESLPGGYDDSQLWNEINKKSVEIENLNIPKAYNDSSINTRIQKLALDLAALNVEVGNIEVGDTSDLQAQVAEISGQLTAMSSIDMTSDDGSVDLGPLVVRIATAEGTLSTLRSSIDSMKSDIRTVKSDITAVGRVANSAENKVNAATSGGSTTVENRYDDSDLRSRISTVERQVNSLPTASSSGGTTIQRVENDFDDATLRSDISALQTAVAVLQATGAIAYDDSNLRDMIDNIQWELENINIPVASNNTADTEWLEDLIHSIKDELSWRLDELEWASDTTTTSDDMYADKWMVEDLQYEVMYIQEQVWELQTLVQDSQSSSTTSSNSTTSSSTSTSGRSWDGSWNEPYWLRVDHNEPSYTGDYYMDGYWDGYAVWINWECDTPGSQFEYCYIFKYNHTSWVIQPLEPSNDWLANAYNDNGEWPWQGTWAGSVNSIEVLGE
jgi:hypothetical protein